MTVNRIDIALFGATEREIEVYGQWLRRLCGDRAVLRPGDAGNEPGDPAIVIVDIDSHGEGLPVTDDRPVVTVGETSSVDAAAGRLGRRPDAHLAKPLSRARFQAALGPLLRTGSAMADATPVVVDVMQGGSAAMGALRAQIARVAGSSAPVFIAGEAATGKASCARAIHAASARSDRPFVVFDCAAAGLRDGDLFAIAAQPEGDGAVRRADGGTLYLHHVHMLPSPAQARLLRFIQTGSLIGTHAGDVRACDVRLVCSVATPAEGEAAPTRLLDELFYRLYVLPLTVPPLRRRRDDIPPLAEAILARLSAGENRRFAAIDAAAAARLAAHDWRGNLRELESVLRQVVVLNDAGTVTADMLPAAIRRAAGRGDDLVIPDRPGLLAECLRRIETTADGIAPMWLQEQRIIEMALAACEGHVGRAAEALEISPSTIYRKMQAWQDRAVA